MTALPNRRAGRSLRISTLLFAVLTGTAGVVVLGLVATTLRLVDIRAELHDFRENSLPRLVKLAQLAQDSSASSSIAPALSMRPTRSEFDTLLSRIRDKENAQRALISELDALGGEPESLQALRRNSDLLIANLADLTAAVGAQIEVTHRVDQHRTGFQRFLREFEQGKGEADAEALLAKATAAVLRLSNLLLDTNRARFPRNQSSADTVISDLSGSVDAGEGIAEVARMPVQQFLEAWAKSRDAVLADKSEELTNAFRIKALAEENALIANRLLSTASTAFWNMNAELEAEIRYVNDTVRFTLFAIFLVLIFLGTGYLAALVLLKKRVFARLQAMSAALGHFANDRRRVDVDGRRDEIGEISNAMHSYMGVIDDRETELAQKTEMLEHLSNQLAKYLSPQVYNSIFTGQQDVKVESRRKKLTIFFSDIADFTETADRLESEELTQLLNHYLTEMSQIALAHGATIDKYVGDAILLFFGDPETRGVAEDARACLRMAVAMRRRMLELQEHWRRSGIEKPLQVRMGVHTGYCTVGNFGSEDRMDYTIIGGAVNIASRLEELARPGQILISFETHALVNTEIVCQERGAVEVKGIAYPVKTFEVVDLIENTTMDQHQFREETAHASVHLEFSQMVGKDRQKARDLLNKALLHLDQADRRGSGET